MQNTDIEKQVVGAIYNVFPSTNFFTGFLLILDVLALTGLAVGIPVRYFLLGDDQQAQRKLVLAKQRPADFSYGTECSTVRE